MSETYTDAEKLADLERALEMMRNYEDSNGDPAYPSWQHCFGCLGNSKLHLPDCGWVAYRRLVEGK